MRLDCFHTFPGEDYRNVSVAWPVEYLNEQIDAAVFARCLRLLADAIDKVDRLSNNSDLRC